MRAPVQREGCVEDNWSCFIVDQSATLRPTAGPSNVRFSIWFVTLAAFFVTCLVVANIISVKFIALPGGFVVPAGIVIFPLSYLFSDVLTEVYGYAAARGVIWLGFGCNVLAVLAIQVSLLAPTASPNQSAFAQILGPTPLILLASFSAYLFGEFINSIVLAKLKVATKGRWLWTRTIGSTLVGEGVDTIIFLAILALGGILPAALLISAIITQWTLKVLYEVVATPFTYAAVRFLKQREHQDPFDTNTNFSPIVFARMTARS